MSFRFLEKESLESIKIGGRKLEGRRHILTHFKVQTQYFNFLEYGKELYEKEMKQELKS